MRAVPPSRHHRCLRGISRRSSSFGFRAEWTAHRIGENLGSCEAPIEAGSLFTICSRRRQFTEGQRPFWCMSTAVLNCANGYPKEGQEEVRGIEEKRQQEGFETSTEAENS